MHCRYTIASCLAAIIAASHLCINGARGGLAGRMALEAARRTEFVSVCLSISVLSMYPRQT